MLSWIFLNTIQLALYDPYDIKALMPISMRRVVMENVGISLISTLNTVLQTSHFLAPFFMNLPLCMHACVNVNLSKTLPEKHSLLLSFASLTLHSVHAGHARRTFSALFLLECLMKILAWASSLGSMPTYGTLGTI